ncbi:epithelial cell adhesion molecule-like isoform X2 [Notolabrus celidotus]|nr:epithelial cell adhesion molecule-like isoform X2 [Notolabrus celidotus]XP_034537497.1 epithelial cell adhesion molecule-like isoform X2 [Notolabrus celidotus]
MKAEMYRAKKGLDTRTIGGKPLETSFIYNPECENDGMFKAKQCNDSSECWCVNSAGFRRTDKGDKDLKCEKLVKTNKVHLDLIHKSVDGEVDAKKLEVHFKDEFHKRYNNSIKDIDRMLSIEYHPKDRWIAVVVKELEGVENTDLTSLAYYIENDVKLRPLFETSEMFKLTVGTIKLELKEIKVFSMDEKSPTSSGKLMSNVNISILVVALLMIVVITAWICISQYRQRQERRQHS